MCVSPQRRALFRHVDFKKCSEPEVFCTFSLANVRFATAACTFSTCWLQKGAPNMRCFVHFHLRMRVSPQRRALFRHLDFKKCSKHEVFCTFSLANVRFATAACNFWFLRETRTSAPAALTGLLFHWPDARIIEKTQHFATSLTFRANVSSFFWLSDYCIFCRLTWLLDDCAFHLLFNSPYCRKFLFKLPSISESLIFQQQQFANQSHQQSTWSLTKVQPTWRNQPPGRCLLRCAWASVRCCRQQKCQCLHDFRRVLVSGWVCASEVWGLWLLWFRILFDVVCPKLNW